MSYGSTRVSAFLFAGSLLLSSGWVLAQTFTDAGSWGDYKLQGEYVGDITKGDGSKQKLGLQMRPMGGGKFVCNFLPGGLPGEGWNGYEWYDADGGTTCSTDEGWSVTLAGDGQSATGKTAKGESFSLKKVLRKSPTDGLKPTAGADILFSGKGSEAGNWNCLECANEGATTNIDGQTVLNDARISAKTFSDHYMHMEFRVSGIPTERDQSRGNSGVFIEWLYEIQILESFGMHTGNAQLGGFYRFFAPRINMAYPALSWQTWDIYYKKAVMVNGKKTENARCTMYWNGVLVHDDVELRGPPGYQRPEGESNTKGGVMLQQRAGQPTVFFRNIWSVDQPYAPKKPGQP